MAALGAQSYHDAIHVVAPAARACMRDPSFRTRNDLEKVQKQLAKYPLGVLSGLTKVERNALALCETYNGPSPPHHPAVNDCDLCLHCACA